MPAPIGLTLHNVTLSGNATTLTAWTPPADPFDFGGTVFTRLAYLNVTNSRFIGNVANNSAGGAIHGRSSTISVSGTEFVNNASNGGGLGGALHLDGMSPGGANGAVHVSTSIFRGNTALQQGGAISFFAHDGLNESLTVDTVDFADNRVVDGGNVPSLGTRGWGGALAGTFGTVNVHNSTFSGNSARGQVAAGGGGVGGAIALTRPLVLSVFNTTVSGNRSFGSATDSLGGGIYVFLNQHQTQIRHSAIVGNDATTAGGGIYAFGSGLLWNSLLAHNTGGRCAPMCIRAQQRRRGHAIPG